MKRDQYTGISEDGYQVPGTGYSKPGNAEFTQLLSVLVCLCKHYTNLDFSTDFNKIQTPNDHQISEVFSKKMRPVAYRDPCQTGIFVPPT